MGSIRTSVIAWLALLVAVVAGFGVASWTYGRADAERSVAILHDLERGLIPAGQLAGIAKDIRYNVVQVQQFMNDAALAGQRDGVAASMKEAEAYGQAFHAAVTAGLRVADGLGQSAAVRMLRDAEARFPAYQQAGVAMVDAYVTRGGDAGKAAMALFDPQADALNAITAQLDEAATGILSLAAHDLHERADEQAAMAGSAARIGPAASVMLNVICLLGGFGLIRGVVRPLVAMAATTRDLTAGNLDIEVPAAKRRDEVGALAGALTRLRDTARHARDLEQEAVQARGHAEQEKASALSHMAERIEHETADAVAHVTDDSAEMAALAESMTLAARNAGAATREALGTAQTALGNAETMASAAEELSASINEISHQIKRSTHAVSEAVAAGEGTRQAIDALTARVGQIGSVSQAIAEIAGKTNLLALNATIEAARAGEAGKGFAVVAGEVKQLASQTARSTDDISRHIAEVRSATEEAVEAVRRMKAMIGQVDSVAASIAEAVTQQTAATEEIARSVAETAEATRQVAGQITTVAEGMEQTCTQAVTVHTRADGVAQAVGQLAHVVTRVVRTSTGEVNRRHSERYSVNLQGRVVIGNQPAQVVRVANLSGGGALILGAPQVPEGSAGVLHLPGVDVALPFRVRHVEAHEGGRAFNVAFQLDEAAAARFRGMPERLAERAVAA